MTCAAFRCSSFKIITRIDSINYNSSYHITDNVTSDVISEKDPGAMKVIWFADMFLKLLMANMRR